MSKEAILTRETILIGWKSIASVSVLNCCVKHARKLAKKEGLPVFKKGGRIYSIYGDILDWLHDDPPSKHLD